MALCFIFMLVYILVRTHAYSLLTDGENKTSTTLEGKEHACNDLSFLRQMINQETVIRLSLVKNVQALVSDVNLMKKSITTSEMTISALQQTIETLNVRVHSLEEENKRLKESSVDHQERIHDLETTLETVNKSVNSLNENLDTAQKQNDEKRQDIVNKTNRVLEDIKVEVRYLSVTLFDFKDHTATKDEINNKKFIDLERHVNTSFEELQAENLKNKGEFNEIKEHIHNVEEVQTEYRKTVTENLTSTIAEVETQSRKSEYERLKLSSAVSSLEAFRMNMTQSNCNTKSKIAFSAGIPSYDDNWTGSTLVFPDIIYSEGKGYDSNTGVFTAPTEGTYLFYISIQSAYRKYIYLDIVLNGSSKVRSMAFYGSGRTISIYQTGTNLVILHLTVGDRVWVKRTDGTGYYSDSGHVCTFSGIRLY
uniref:Protein lava lamp-like n=1 Tax=Crassostrea virginica TaxID=6565 RepID=A0A8B8AQF0_CRAVI|nr:protein lava lamp-like [Crassostrea virginica]